MRFNVHDWKVELLPWSSNQAIEEWYIFELRQVHQRHAQEVWHEQSKGH